MSYIVCRQLQLPIPQLVKGGAFTEPCRLTHEYGLIDVYRDGKNHFIAGRGIYPNPYTDKHSYEAFRNGWFDEKDDLNASRNPHN